MDSQNPSNGHESSWLAHVTFAGHLNGRHTIFFKTTFFPTKN